jgi:hypothetical protein
MTIDGVIEHVDAEMPVGNDAKSKIGRVHLQPVTKMDLYVNPRLLAQNNWRRDETQANDYDSDL